MLEVFHINFWYCIFGLFVVLFGFYLVVLGWSQLHKLLAVRIERCCDFGPSYTTWGDRNRSRFPDDPSQLSSQDFSCSMIRLIDFTESIRSKAPKVHSFPTQTWVAAHLNSPHREVFCPPLGDSVQRSLGRGLLRDFEFSKVREQTEARHNQILVLEPEEQGQWQRWFLPPRLRRLRATGETPVRNGPDMKERVPAPADFDETICEISAEDAIDWLLQACTELTSLHGCSIGVDRRHTL